MVIWKLFFIIFLFYPLSSLYTLPDPKPTLKRCYAFKEPKLPMDNDVKPVTNVVDRKIIMSSKNVMIPNSQRKRNFVGKCFRWGIDLLDLTNNILDFINNCSEL